MPFVWLSQIGYDEIIQAPLNDTRVSDTDDNTALRYLCAAITEQNICTHIAAQYRRQGRAAWAYLDKEFGLPSTRQTKLRDDLKRMEMKPDDDPRLFVMLFDRICKRISPTPEPKEICELLLEKVPPQFNDIVTNIQASPCMDCEDDAIDYDTTERGVRGRFIRLIKSRRDSYALASARTQVHSLSVGDVAEGADPDGTDDLKSKDEEIARLQALLEGSLQQPAAGRERA